ncbi:MAG: methyltransferase domain-containing protein [Planctomycetales bacterium]|nr:methyltransferase domain-containing protein [Planctomycetales bacterium]
MFLVLQGQRELVPELMDDPSLCSREHARALAGLRRINWVCQTSRQLVRVIRQELGKDSESISVLDIGAGGGDVAAGVYHGLLDRGYTISIRGWDVSSTAVGIANARHRQARFGSDLSFEVVDIWDRDRQDRFDIVYCSLFLHHFSTEQAVQVVRCMRRRCKRLLIVDDLVRSQLGLWMAQVGCRLMSRSPVVRFDGPQSVRAAFSRSEFGELARAAELGQFKMRCHWPQRMYLMWRFNDN